MKIDPEDYATVSHKELKVEGSLLRNIGKVVRAHIGYGISEQKERRKAMADLFKDFQDWLSYNHPEAKLEPLQEDLMRIALRNYNTKVPKVAAKAILRKLAELVFKGTKPK